MRRSRAATALLAALALAAMAPASASHAADCADARDQTTMNICADAAYRKTDAELNTVYGQVTTRLKGDEKTTRRLIAAQKSWIAFRDAECAFATSGSADGTVYPMLVSQCRDGMTRKRIVELKAYLNCAEGDLSCPVPPK